MWTVYLVAVPGHPVSRECAPHCNSGKHALSVKPASKWFDNYKILVHRSWSLNVSRGAERQQVRTILIIDEDRCIRLMLAEVVRCAGYSAVMASCPDDALATTVGQRVDLVVADVGSPEAKPALREFLAALTERGQTVDVPVVLLTSAGHLLKASELTGLGVQLILSKPLSTRELLADVAKLLDVTAASQQEAA